MLTEREKSMTRGLMEAVKDMLEPLRDENSQLRAELAILKARFDERPVPKDGKDGRDGVDGKDAPPVDLDTLIEKLSALIPPLIPAPLKGDRGEPGPAGIDGKDGAPGADGKDGAAGRDGVNGAPGLDGKDGAPGRDGVDGEDGKDGRDGQDGEAGLDGKDGRDGIDGTDGRDGRDGRDGDRGPAGKDAAEIEPLNGMDESVSYQRGTWVAHRGGLFLAFRATDPVVEGDFSAAGWQVVMNGIHDDTSSLQHDGRTVLRSLERSDGRTIVTKTNTFAQIHRGIFRRGLTYERGDTVTWNGSCWHANATTDEEPSSEAKTWTLVTRKGRDGKDLTNGA